VNFRKFEFFIIFIEKYSKKPQIFVKFYFQDNLEKKNFEFKSVYRIEIDLVSLVIFFQAYCSKPFVFVNTQK